MSDFDSVLIRPQRTTLYSRSQVNLETKYTFYHSTETFEGIPIVCSNMGFASYKIAKELQKYKMITCLHKYHNHEEIMIKYMDGELDPKYSWVTIGMNEDELISLEDANDADFFDDKTINICVDVANGHMEKFVNFCSRVRNSFPHSIILAGNVAIPEMTQELIIHGGVDIVKLGIGPGCFVAGTKVITKNGTKNIENISVGDEVVTHKGRYKKVIGTKTRLEKKRIIDINGISCTPNHEFYVVLKSDADLINENNIHEYAKWVPAEDLSEDYLLINIHKNP
jgi:hypothetical protein